MNNLSLYQLTDEYLALMDLAAEEEAMDSPYFSVAVRKNRARVEIDEGADIPPDLYAIIPQQLRPNKVAIAKELESGADIPGCRLVTSTRLDIK